MVWRWQGDKPLYETMMIILLTPICATRPRWVKLLRVSLKTIFVNVAIEKAINIHEIKTSESQQYITRHWRQKNIFKHNQYVWEHVYGIITRELYKLLDCLVVSLYWLSVCKLYQSVDWSVVRESHWLWDRLGRNDIYIYICSFISSFMTKLSQDKTIKTM